MKKRFFYLITSLILVFSLFSCGQVANTDEVSTDFKPITAYEDDNIKISITNYDDIYGEWIFEIYNKTDYNMDCYSDKCVVDDKYAGDCDLWADTMASKTISECSVSIYDNNYDYYVMSDKHSFDISVNYEWFSDDYEIYESNVISFTLTPDMFGY